MPNKNSQSDPQAFIEQSRQAEAKRQGRIEADCQREAEISSRCESIKEAFAAVT